LFVINREMASLNNFPHYILSSINEWVFFSTTK
jgi:hypothetical protein